MEKKEVLLTEYRDGFLVNSETGQKLSGKDLSGYTKTHDIRVESISEHEKAVGASVPRYQKSAVKFLQDLKNYSEEDATIHQQIDLCNKMFRREDTVSTGMEILIDFSINEGQNIGIPEEAQEPFDWFSKNVNKEGNFSAFGLSSLEESLSYEYDISGNVYPIIRWEKVRMESGSYEVPVAIELLNPMWIEVDKMSFAAGKQLLLFGPNKVTTGTSMVKKNVLDLLRNSSGDGFGVFSEKRKKTELDNNFVSHIKRKARDYDEYGIPYLTKIAQAVEYKQRLWQLDIQTIQGLINYITVFKVGSPNPNSDFHDPPQSRISALINLLNNPETATTLVWPHDIEVITAGPNGDILNFNEKYKEANRAIIQGLGIPPILIDGSGTATAAWVAVLALNKRLEKKRLMVKNYVEYVFNQIRMRNGLGEFVPERRYGPSDLQDEKTLKTLLLAYHDRGLLPVQTMHERGGYDHKEMVRIKEAEEDSGVKELFGMPDNVPFTNNSPDPTPGRPSDDTNTDEEDSSANLFKNVEKSVYERFNLQTSKDPELDLREAILGSYEEKLGKLISGMLDSIEEQQRRTPKTVSDVVDIGFVRISQLASVFTSNEDDDLVFSSKMVLWNEKFIAKMKKFTLDKLNSALTKTDLEEKGLLIQGVFSELNKRAMLFAKESLRNSVLTNEISNAKKEGFVGAIFKSNPETKCEFCNELNGEFLTLSEILDTLPAHPHQSFSFEFVRENPVPAGNKKKKYRPIQDPKNKSKKVK